MSFPFDIHERINVNNKYRHCTIDMSLVIHKGDILFLLSMTLTVIILKLFFFCARNCQYFPQVKHERSPFMDVRPMGRNDRTRVEKPVEEQTQP